MERVVIKIEVNVDDRQLDKLLAKLSALESQAKLTGNSFDGLTKNTTKLNDSVDKNSKSMSQMSDKMKKADKNSNILSKTIKGFGKALLGVAKLALKAFLINFAAAVASIAAVTLAFSLGSAIMKGYKASLNVVAAAAATVATALSVAAAGAREYKAAMQVAKYGGMQNATAQVRTLSSNTELAVLGAKALDAAFAGVSEKSRMTGGMNKAITSMGDFAVASGQADKAMGAAGKFLGELASSGKLTKNIADMAAGVGPQFQKAVTEWRKKHGDGTYKEFINALNTGELSKEVAGSLDAVNQTLFGTFKRNFQLIKEQFADMGQPLLPAFTAAIQKIARILQVTLLRIQANMQMFARGSILDSLVAAFQKFSNWAVKAFNEDLPKAIGMIGRMRERFSGVENILRKIGDALKPIREAGKVLWEAFGPLVRGLFTEFGQGVTDLSDLFIKNKSGLMDFGDSLKNLLESVGDLFGEIKKAIVQSLPTLSKLVNVLAQAVSLISALVGGVNSLGEGGSVGLLAGLATLGLAMKGGKGGKGGAGGGSRFGLLAGGAGAGGAGSWIARAGTAGGAIGTAAAIGAPLAGHYLGNEGSRSGFGTAGMLVGGSLALGSMGKLPGYGKLMGRSTSYLGPSGKALPAQSSMAGALSYAAPLAGGAIAGGLASDFALSRYGKNVGSKTHTAMGVGAGALAGAGAGAAIGAMLGPVAPITAPIGAVMGAVGGAIVGFINSGKMKKQAKKQAESFVGNYDTEITKKIESGDYLGAQTLLKQMKAQSGNVASGSKQTDAFTKKYKELDKQLSNKVQPAVNLYNQTLGDLSQNLGIGKDKIEAMAKTLGVTVVGNVETLKAALLGLTPDQMNFEGMRGMMFESMVNTFNKPIALQEAQKAISAEDIRLRDIIGESGAGAINAADIGQYLQTALGYETQSTGDPFKALENMYNKLAYTGATQYQTGGVFAGQGETLAPQFKAQITDSLKNFIATGGLKSAAASLSDAGEEILGYKGSQNQIQKVLEQQANAALTSGTVEDMNKFFATMKSLSGEGVGTDQTVTQKVFRDLLGEARLAELKVDPLVSAMGGVEVATLALIQTLLGNKNPFGAGGISNGGTQRIGPDLPKQSNGSVKNSSIPIPASLPVGPSTSTSTSTTSITINPPPGASAIDIAQIVSKMIEERERNRKERTQP